MGKEWEGFLRLSLSTSLKVLALSIVAYFIATWLLKEPFPDTLPQTSSLNSEMTLISHAGAGLPVGAYSNSREALERGVADGLNFLEVDFSWTSDGNLVLLRDWYQEFDSWFDPSLLYKVRRKLAGRPLPMTTETFLDLEMRHGLTQMTLKDLALWLAAHPDVSIITDVKSENLRGLLLISEIMPNAQRRVVPQIYSFEEYAPVRDMGYEQIIFTGYNSAASDRDIRDFAAQHDLMAVTLPQHRLSSETLSALSDMNTPLWTHTVNDPDLAEQLFHLGVDGLYTDTLVPWQK